MTENRTLKINIMSYWTRLIFICLIIFIFSSCEKPDNDNYKPSVDFSNDKKVAQLISADNAFALDLFREVNALEEMQNYMISPVSVSIALGMTYNGSAGSTKTAFEETLRLTGFDQHEINYIHSELIKHLLKVDPEVIMEIANSIWVNQFYTIVKEFSDTSIYYYDAKINSLNFSDPGSVDIINNWVSDKTHEKITEVLDRIPPDVVMYLINALYFNGTWKYEFDEKDNLPINFKYGDDNRVEVEGMRLTADLDYYKTDMFSLTELPYGNDKYSMLIFLPGEGTSTKEIIDEFTAENWETWMESLHQTSVMVQLPKFKFEYKTLLNKALANMGLGIAFTGGAEFPNLVEESQSLSISRVIHKTFIDVNEKGTEAAAVTVVEIRETSSAGPVPFEVNKPFLFVIREKTSNALVFMGKVGQPEYK